MTHPHGLLVKKLKIETLIKSSFFCKSTFDSKESQNLVAWRKHDWIVMKLKLTRFKGLFTKLQLSSKKNVNWRKIWREKKYFLFLTLERMTMTFKLFSSDSISTSECHLRAEEMVHTDGKFRERGIRGFKRTNEHR